MAQIFGRDGATEPDTEPAFQPVFEPIEVRWLGRIDYREAWDVQHAVVADRQAGRCRDVLLLLEHPAVLTLGRHATQENVLATPQELERRGIELIRVERGGEVTYHGPGQLVAYAIVRLPDRGVPVKPFVRVLEQALIETCAAYGVTADRREGFPGAWCDAESADPRKIAALGIRVEHGVTYHGIALNVTTEIDDFRLIDACGLGNVTITSIAREAGWEPGPPTTSSVEAAARIFGDRFARALDEATAHALRRAAEREAAGGAG